VIVVSDSSPLIALASAGKLHLLHDLFGEVFVPGAVWAEVLHGQRPGAEEIRAAAWIRMLAVASDSFLLALGQDVDPGEAEALLLASDLGADLVVVDERRARALAAFMGLRLTGTVGILLDAKQKGYLAEIRPVIEAMVERVRFRISPRMYRSSLAIAGESWSAAGSAEGLSLPGGAVGV
jgi:predicted nucleic acid-binding protein